MRFENVKQQCQRVIKYRELLFLSLPGLMLLIIFKYIPLFGLILPFKDFRYDLGFWKSKWAGFSNFKFLFNSNSAWIITRNTVLLNLAFIVTTLVVSVAFAIFMFELSKKQVKIVQTAMFFPYFMSWMVVSYICLAIFDMEHGLINSILTVFGYNPVLWYNKPEVWPGILIVVNIWKNAGYYTLLYYTQIIGIDMELYEAAKIDGANKLQQIRAITLPLLKPVIIMLIILQIGKIFYGNFDLFYNVPRDSALLYSTTDVIDTFVYRALRSTGDIGMASAAGAYQSVIGFILVIATNWVVKRIDEESALF